MTDTEAIATRTTTGITPTQRRVALIAVLVVAFLFAARPTTLRFGDDGPTASCGLTTFAFGADEPVVTQACRNAFAGRAAAALVLLGGIALLAAELIPKRETASEDPVAPPANSPGEDPSFLGGLRHASADQSFRILAGLGLALLVVLGGVLRPIAIHTSVLGEEQTVSCGFREHLFGADDASITATCREAYAARAAGGLIVLLGLGVAVAMMAWIVQYHRGAALGSIWHRAGVPAPVLARTGGGCALVAVVALLAASQGAAPATSQGAAPATSQGAAPATSDGAKLASAPADSPPPDAPTADEVTPQPTFLTPAVPARPGPPGPTPGTASNDPLTVRDASWYSATPNPLDTLTVPEGSLPVGATAGEADMHAFFRLSGTARTLTLVESDHLGSQRFADQAQIAVCPVTAAGWEQTTGGSFDDQPPFDDSACINAIRASDGTWTVDLSGFDDRGGNRGFALIPSEADGQTFRVTLVSPTEDGP